MVQPNFSPLHREALAELRSHDWPDVELSLDGQAIEIGPKKPPRTGSACRIRIGLVSADEVVYVVGHTQIEDASERSLELHEILEGPIAWVEAARAGLITERVGRKGGRVVKSVVMRREGREVFKATETSAWFPWGIAWDEIVYVTYPPVD